MKTEQQEIKNFISKLINKDYKEAHNSLQQAVEAKIKSRVKTVVSQKN